MKIIIKIILFTLAVILFGDLSYATYIKIKIKMFNDYVRRDEHGFLVGSEPISAGKGENAILFVHGFNDSPAVWKTWAPFFSENGFYCKAIRLLGSSYDMDAKRSITIETRMEQIKSEYEQIKKTHEKVVLCTHSMGGAYVTAMVASNQIDPDILVLVAPMFGISSKKSPIFSPKRWLKIGSKIAVFTDTIENIMPMDIADKSVIPEYPVHPFIPLSLYDTLFELIDICATKITSINTPTIIMVGKNDTVVDKDVVVDYYNKIPAKQKSIIVDEHLGHVIPRDFENQTQAKLLLENINKFLKTNR